MNHKNEFNGNNSSLFENKHIDTEIKLDNLIETTNNKKTHENFPNKAILNKNNKSESIKQSLNKVNDSSNLESIIRHTKPRNLTLNSKLSDLGNKAHFLFEYKYKRNEKDLFSQSKETEFYHSQMMINYFVLSLSSLISIACAIIGFEFVYKDADETHIVFTAWICTLSSIVLWFNLVCNFYFETKIKALKLFLEPRILFRRQKTYIALIIELILAIPHPCPLFTEYFVTIPAGRFNLNTQYPLNVLMTSICLFRIIHFVKYFLIISEYLNPRSFRVGKIFSYTINNEFALKANMVQKPYLTYSFLFFLCVFYGTYNIRMYDYYLDEVSGKKMGDFSNSLWMIIVTITTVGYGDLVPQSLPGRIVGGVTTILGLFLISILIVTVTNIFNFTPIELNVYMLLERLQLTKEKNEIAARLVRRYMMLMKKLKKDPNDKSITSDRNKLHYDLYYFRQKCEELDNNFPPYNNFTYLCDKLEIIESGVQKLKEKYDDLEKYFEKQKQDFEEEEEQ